MMVCRNSFLGLKNRIALLIVTRFFYQDLEAWFFGEAGDTKLLSEENFEHDTDLEMLKAPPVPMHKFVDILVYILE
jgi:hypothetical protein